MKNLIKLTIFFVIFASITTCNAQDVNPWLKKIAEGKNIDMPYIAISDFCLKTKIDYAIKLRKFLTPEQQEFINVISQQRLFPFTSIPKEVISGILNRRTPVLNLYKFNLEPLGKVRPPGTPKYVAFQFPEGYYDYLGIIQKLILKALINRKDTRFESEVTALIDYLCAPIPENLWFEHMYDVDARACYGTRLDLTSTALAYLNCCRGNNGKSLFKLYTDKYRLISEYGFGKNCHYYDLKNWPEFVKKPPTEEEMRRFHEISKQWREESERRWKKKSVSRDEAETAVHRLQQALEQPNISSQEREYLGRRINYIKNKKYDDD
jgi:hypothetical protein